MNYTPQEVKQAKRLAYLYATSVRATVLKMHFVYDKRTRIGRLAYTMIPAIRQHINTDQIIEKRKQRAALKKEDYKQTTNILDTPIVKDYIRNRPLVVYPDRLKAQNRNHWAKDDRDKKILEILMKYNKQR